jgi:hypothetical protein
VTEEQTSVTTHTNMENNNSCDTEATASRESARPNEAWLKLIFALGLYGLLMLAVCYVGAAIKMGYQSPHLSLISKPMIQVMNASGVESLECDSLSVVEIEVEGTWHSLPSPPDSPIKCPVHQVLSINAEREVRLFPRVRFNPMATQDLEDDLMSVSLVERRQQFLMLAESIRPAAAKIRADLDRENTEKKKRSEERRKARATWQDG